MSDPQLPTADQVFGAGKSQPHPSLPTADQVFGPSVPVSAGQAQDDLWSSPYHAGARVLSAFGQSAKDGWGSEPIGLPQEDVQALRNVGVFNNYAEGQASIFKAFNEAVLRPAVAVADLGFRAIKAPLYGVGGALEQSAKEVQGQHPTALTTALATPLGGAGEIIGSIPEGSLIGFEGATAPKASRGPQIVHEASQARALGVIGEGEAGFHEAAPLTPENTQARAEAASNAGIEQPPPPVAPPPDIHALARRIDPETFEKYDALAREAGHQRQTLQKLATEREAAPEVQAAKDRLNELLGGEGQTSAESIRASFEPEHPVARAQAALDTAMHTDTAEMATVRSALLDADFAMRDMVPDVAAAYRQARDILPQEAAAPKPSETGPSAEQGQKPEGQKPQQQASPQPLPKDETTIAAQAAEAATRPRVAPVAAQRGEEVPPNVTGGKSEGQEFTTAKGSTYIIHEDGTTTRNKSFHPEHGEADQGVQPRSEKTFYVSPEDADKLSLFQTQGGKKSIEPVGTDGHWGVKYLDGKDAGKFEKRTVVKPSETPETGTTPVEIFNGGKTVHFGNPITEVRGSSETTVETPQAEPVEGTPPKQPAGRGSALKPIEGTGDVRERGLSQSVRARALASGFADEFGPLPEYHELDFGQQAEKWIGLLDSDPAFVKEVAMGRKPPPKGLLARMAFKAVEDSARASGDLDTVIELGTKSRLLAQSTEMGREIAALGYNFDPTSPVSAIREVQSAREAVAQKRGINIAQETDKAVAEMKAEVKKAASKPPAFQAFLESIQCGE